MLTIVAATAIVAAAVGYLAARSRGPSGAKKPAPDAKLTPPRKDDAKPKAAASPFDGMPLALGDVVVADAEERWLAGALLLREGPRVVAALFLSPEGAEVRAVAAFEEPRRDIYWLSSVEVVTPAEPPATLEIGEAMLTRRSRLPVSIERLGQGAPHVGEAALWAMYEGGGRDVAVLLSGGGKVHAWRGVRLEEGAYDRFGSGGTGDE